LDESNLEYQELVKTVAQAVYERISGRNTDVSSSHSIPVEVSNHHVHLTQESLNILYGRNYQLNKLRDLSQPGEFASKETVMLVSPNKVRTINQVRILGPVRAYDQVELSFSDGIFLGLKLPIRVSGEIQGSEPITLVGPKGILKLKQGALRAARHVHMTPEDAINFKVKNFEKVDVEIPGEYGVILRNVIIRVSSESKLALHLDTDEGNAANVMGEIYARILR
jgi:putative phosphotransacetylase